MNDLHTQHDWQTQAACAGTDTNLFFPEQGQPSQPAKQICTTCPVRRQCLDYCLDHDIHYGVWGGTSARERRQMRYGPVRHLTIVA